MGKQRLISAHSDLKTGFFCKFFIILGVSLMVIYAIVRILQPGVFGDVVEGALIAFARAVAICVDVLAGVIAMMIFPPPANASVLNSKRRTMPVLPVIVMTCPSTTAPLLLTERTRLSGRVSNQKS